MVASPLFLQQAVSERMISSHKWEESLLASKYVGINDKGKVETKFNDFGLDKQHLSHEINKTASGNL